MPMTDLTVLLQSPELNAQLVVDGMLAGAIFALAAYGMALVWGVMNLINVAQGELVMLGGYMVIWLVGRGVPAPLAVPLAAAAMYAVGWALYRIVIFRLVERDLFVSLLATFGLSIVLQQLANLVFGANVRTLDAGFGSLFLPGGLVVPKVKLAAFAAALALGAALMLFLRHSRRGQAIRATAQNARAARVLGVDTDRVYATTFALNAAICGAAGGLVAMTWIIHPYLGLPYTVRAFMIVVVAGLGSMLPVLGAAGGLGIAENYAGFLLGVEYQTAFLYALLVAILVSRNLMLRRHRGYLR
ncbi:branched-chain amino acid ABC transporter permease [Cupriavidus oxalaticus]|uniref:branched-chain amino acid ABC transporter permease n=1 Tax=Cupriavidus oxalaticus TaxID=96344 RepID=UPI00317C6395